MRIVSLCPSTTESLARIVEGSEDGPRLVGVTRFCVHPEPVVSTLTRVGGTKDPKLERIVDLAPDLVVMNREENRIEDHDALVAAGLRVIADMPRTVAEVPGHLRWLGEAVGCEQRAETEARRVEVAMEEAGRARAEFRFAYLIWRRPWMAVGPDTYTDDLLSRAGGRNVVGGSRYPELELAQLADADVILLPDEPFPFGEKHLPELRAQLPKARFRFVDGEAHCWHGVRTEAGLHAVAELAREMAESAPG